MSIQLDHGRNKLQSVVALGEKTVRHTADVGSEAITNQLALCKDEYERICSAISTATQDLEQAVEQWSGFDELYLRLDKWLKDTDDKISTELELRSNIESKKSAQEKLMVSFNIRKWFNPKI